MDHPKQEIAMKPIFSLITALVLAPLAALYADNKPTTVWAAQLVETVSEKIFSLPSRSGKNKLNLTFGDAQETPI